MMGSGPGVGIPEYPYFFGRVWRGSAVYLMETVLELM